jgi:hypothetical protein
VRDGAPIEELRAVAVRGVQSVIKAFEDEQAAKADLEMRARIVQSPLPFWISPEGLETVQGLIQEMIASLPVGTPRAKLEQAREQVLGDLEAAVRQRQAEREAQAKAKEPPVRSMVATSTKGVPQTATGRGTGADTPLRPVRERTSAATGRGIGAWNTSAARDQCFAAPALVVTDILEGV